MIKDKNTTIAYHCPHCGSIIINTVNIFALSGRTLHIKCTCKGSDLLIQITSEKKIRLSVPCILCPSPHSYTLTTDAFFERELFALTCTMCGLDICFFGQKDAVMEAIRESEEDLVRFFSEGLEDDGDEEEPGEYSLYQPGTDEPDPGDLFYNPAVMEAVLASLLEMAKADKIECGCGFSDISIDTHYDRVVLTCKMCGGTRTVRARFIADMDYLADMEMLCLDD